MFHLSQGVLENFSNSAVWAETSLSFTMTFPLHDRVSQHPLFEEWLAMIQSLANIALKLSQVLLQVPLPQSRSGYKSAGWHSLSSEQVFWFRLHETLAHHPRALLSDEGREMILDSTHHEPCNLLAGIPIPSWELDVKCTAKAIKRYGSHSILQAYADLLEPIQPFLISVLHVKPHYITL